MKHKYTSDNNKYRKKVLGLLLATAIISISSCTNSPGSNYPEQSGDPPVQVNIKNQVFKVSEKKGASISIKINPRLNFSTKATASGSFAKTYLNIRSYLIYLIKSPSGSPAVFPLNGDPLLSTGIVFSVKVNTNEDSTALVTFTNLLASPANSYYHVAVRAYDGPVVSGNNTGNEIIKNNNGSLIAWTGTTALTPKVAVSTGNGIQVDSNFNVSSTTPLEVTPNLLDEVGTSIDMDISVAGETKSEIAYYKVNLCTDPARPVSTQVFTAPVRINRIYSQYNATMLHRIKIINVPLGTYYATAQAFDAANNNITATNNRGTVYTDPDSATRIAVSTSRVTVGNNLALTFSPASPAQLNITMNFRNYLMTTIAGTGTSGNAPAANSVAINTVLNTPYGVAVDAEGNVYIANQSNHTIRKVTPAGIMSTIAGTGTSGNAPVADSVATSTALFNPNGVAVDAAGNVYIANTGNHTIRKVTSAGIMSTIAGTGTSGHAPAADSVATSTALNDPNGVAVDATGNVYIANTTNHTIRKVTPSGSMSTIAGTGTSGNAPAADSLATATALNAPLGVAVDATGNVYIANSNNHTIRKVTPAGTMSKIAGTALPGNAPVADSLATSTTLSLPHGIAVDAAGNVYIANTNDHSIRKVIPAGIMSTIAGTGTSANASVADSIATSTTLNTPKGIAIDPAGNIYIANTNNHTIRKLFLD